MQVLHDTLNPVWNQTFDIVVEDGLHEMLILEVWDHDTFGKVDYIGPFSFIPRKFMDTWFRIGMKYKPCSKILRKETCKIHLTELLVPLLL